MKRSLPSQVGAAHNRVVVLVAVIGSRVDGLRRVDNRLQGLRLGGRSLSSGAKHGLALDKIGYVLSGRTLRDGRRMGERGRSLNSGTTRNGLSSRSIVPHKDG